MALSFFFVLLELFSANVKAQEVNFSPISPSKIKQLSQSTKWLKLGHYKKTLFGQWHSQLQGTFFLSPQGALDPQAELQESIKVLFFKSPLLQCKYLSRTQWLIQELQISKPLIQSCPEREDWKRKLNAKEIFIVFATNDPNSMSASFGHTFLRLHNPENRSSLDLVDYGINYAAATGQDSGALIALKGLFGGYFGFYSMLPYHQKMREYTNLEGRDLWEYQLKLNESEIDELINHVLELEGSGSPYYFLDNNCSQQILELFEVVRPDLELTKYFKDATIPLDTIKILSTKSDLLGAVLYRTSLQTKFRRDFARLTFAEKKIFKDTLAEPKFKIDNLALEKVSKIRLYDAKMNFLAIEAYRNQKDNSEKIYPLAVARSKLGLNFEPEKFQLENPLLSSSSAAFYLGVGRREQEDFYQFKYRRAFHDILSRDQGLAPFSHIEVLSFEWRYLQSQQQVDLQHLTLLNLISTNPVTLLDTPLSWQMDLGTAPKLSPYLKGGAGLSFDLWDSRWTHLIFAKLQLDNPKNYVGFGFRTFLLSHWRSGNHVGLSSDLQSEIVSEIRSLLQLTYLPTLGTTPNLEIEAGLSRDINRELELRISALHESEKNSLLVSLIF